jgi:hypothetical protein
MFLRGSVMSWLEGLQYTSQLMQGIICRLGQTNRVAGDCMEWNLYNDQSSYLVRIQVVGLLCSFLGSTFLVSQPPDMK